jgi:hypothetical protein
MSSFSVLEIIRIVSRGETEGVMKSEKKNTTVTYCTSGHVATLDGTNAIYKTLFYY